MFFDNYVNQCNKKGISPTAAALEMGFYRSEVTRWGKGTTPRRANLLKMATYFGCTVDDLLAETKTPATDGDGLANIIKNLPPATQETLVRFLRIAPSNPDKATRFLLFAVEVLESDAQDH